MVKPTESDSTDIRRAIDRLQATLGELGDRYQELRRERKQFRARIEELEQEHENAETNTAARLETAGVDRMRAIELEDRVVKAEKRSAELYDRQRDLEVTLSERESFIVEQEETITSLRTRIDNDRQREEQSEQSLRQGQELHAQIEELQRHISSLQTDRRRLEEQQHQLISKLDVSTRDSGLARMRVAELEEQLKQLEALQARNEELRATVEAHAGNGLAKEESAIGTDDRREMAQQIQQAIRLIDKHLEGT